MRTLKEDGGSVFEFSSEFSFTYKADGSSEKVRGFFDPNERDEAGRVSVEKSGRRSFFVRMCRERRLCLEM